MNNDKKLIPALRFPEFINDGQWKEKKLKEVFNSFSGGTPSTSEKGYYGGNIPFIRSAEIGKLKTELYITEDGLKNSSAKLVNQGDLLVALYGANSGDAAISKIDGAINQAVLCLQSEYSNTFTYNFFTLKKDWIVSRYVQGGQGNLSGNIVKSIQLCFPKKEEQQKIASCLSSLDELITAHSDKLEVLKEHKKGLLQNLLPQKGEKLPKSRFPEFKGKLTWQEKRLSEILNEHRLKSEGGDEIYSVSVYKGVINQNEHLGRRFAAKNTDNYKRVLPGDIIYTKSPTGDFPYGIIKRSNASKPVIVSPLYGVFTPKNSWIGIILDAYFEHPARTNAYLEPIIQKGAKNTINIKNDTFLSRTLTLPVDSNEQEKIAYCLSSLDELITAEEKKIEELQLHKKGLMQNLFPKIDE
jgi:type I restriction enzyme S subunit